MLYVKNGSKGDLDLSDLNLTKLPEILKNISVGRDFFCGTNNLTSLENCPKTVGGSFYCGHNKLTSLEGAPKTVNGHFFCYQNPVKFTEKQVRAVSDVKGMVGV